MKELNLNEINGKEIIDYLNTMSSDYNPDLDDISIVLGSFKFRNQSVKNNQYCLEFTASYNHWGEHHEYHNNKLCLTEDSIRLYLDEPFEGDGTDELLEIIIMKWLEHHTFVDYKDVFYENTGEISERLLELKFSDTKEMDEIIKILIEVRSIMK